MHGAHMAGGFSVKFAKQAALASRLFEATSEGTLEWKPSSARPNAFQVNFANYAVVLSNDVDDYFVELFNGHGEAADVFDDSQLDEEAPMDAPVEGSWAKTMRETHRLARRAALGADKALDDILAALETA
jgi:hypothetical protein